MAQALVQTPAEQPDFARMVRANLSGWESQVLRRRAVLDHWRIAIARDSARFRPDGRAILTLCDDRTARLWDVATGRPLCPPLHHQFLVLRRAFSPDGRYLATGCQDGSIRLWDAVTGKPSGPALDSGGDTGPRAAVVDITFSPDGRLLLEPRSQEGTGPLGRHDGPQTGDAEASGTRRSLPGFLPDGRRVMLVNDAWQMAGIWDARTGSLRAPTIRGQHLGFGEVFASGRNIAISEAGLAGFFAGGRVMGTSSDGQTARLWDANTGRAVVTLPPAASVLVWATLSPDGRYLFTCYRDATALIWDVVNDRPAAGVLPRTGFGPGGSFSPDGRLFVTVGPLPPLGSLMSPRAGRSAHPSGTNDRFTRRRSRPTAGSSSRSVLRRSRLSGKSASVIWPSDSMRPDAATKPRDRPRRRVRAPSLGAVFSSDSSRILLNSTRAPTSSSPARANRSAGRS